MPAKNHERKDISMSSIAEIVAGTAVEVVIFGVAGGVLYRVWKQASFLPQRKTLLPFNRGVLLEGEHVVKVLEPGSYWIKPKQTFVPVDVRPRPFQMSPRELVTSDGRGLRIRFNGAYQIVEPALFLQESSDGFAALYLSLEREIAHTVAELDQADILAGRVSPTDRVKERIEPRATQLGIAVSHLEVSDLLPIAWAQQSFES
jgi:regulator of protease activity HflC (stomatin/prohibitin superfamily)